MPEGAFSSGSHSTSSLLDFGKSGRELNRALMRRIKFKDGLSDLKGLSERRKATDRTEEAALRVDPGHLRNARPNEAAFNFGWAVKGREDIPLRIGA